MVIKVQYVLIMFVKDGYNDIKGMETGFFNLVIPFSH